MAVGVKMRKGNKVIHVEASRVDSFLAQGYDQVNEKGEIIRRATGGRTVNIAEYNAVVEELETLKATKIKELTAEIEALKKENAALKGKITKLEKGMK